VRSGAAVTVGKPSAIKTLIDLVFSNPIIEISAFSRHFSMFPQQQVEALHQAAMTL